MIFNSDVLIWVFRRDAAAVELVEGATGRAASIITLMELMQGVRSKAELTLIRQFFADLAIQVIPVNEAISHVAATLIEEHALASGLQIPDALIAATARERGEVLATASIRHFRPIRNLELKAFRPARHSVS